MKLTPAVTSVSKDPASSDQTDVGVDADATRHDPTEDPSLASESHALLHGLDRFDFLARPAWQEDAARLHAEHKARLQTADVLAAIIQQLPLEDYYAQASRLIVICTFVDTGSCCAISGINLVRGSVGLWSKGHNRCL